MLDKAQKITLIGGIINLLLAIIKIIAGFFGGSSALIADGIHSLSDLISDFLVFFVAGHSKKAPDKEHPYGHQKFDTLATLGLGIILIIIGLGIIYDSIINFNTKAVISYDYLLIAIAIISILSKEFLYHITIRVGKKTNSKMLIANAWHHRLDSLSSIIVLIGIIGAINGYQSLDKIAAIIIALLIFHIAFDLLKDSINELVDSSISESEIKKLNTAILQIGGVVNTHSLRARRFGGNIIADVHIQVEPRISVSEGHIISVEVEKIAKQCLNNLTEVIVHIDPEDDKHTSYANLPNRSVALGIINKLLLDNNCKCDKNIQNIVLHYLSNKIEIDFYLSLECIKDYKNSAEIKNILNNLFNDLPYFGRVKVFFS